MSEFTNEETAAYLTTYKYENTSRLHEDLCRFLAELEPHSSVEVVALAIATWKLHTGDEAVEVEDE